MSLLDFVEEGSLSGDQAQYFRVQTQSGAVSTTACPAVTPLLPGLQPFSGWKFLHLKSNSANDLMYNGNVRSRLTLCFFPTSMLLSLPKKRSLGSIFQSDVNRSLPVMAFGPHLGCARLSVGWSLQKGSSDSVLMRCSPPASLCAADIGLSSHKPCNFTCICFD